MGEGAYQFYSPLFQPCEHHCECGAIDLTFFYYRSYNLEYNININIVVKFEIFVWKQDM
jgi:hypothetical protein